MTTPLQCTVVQEVWESSGDPVDDTNPGEMCTLLTPYLQPSARFSVSRPATITVLNWGLVGGVSARTRWIDGTENQNSSRG